LTDATEINSTENTQPSKPK